MALIIKNPRGYSGGAAVPVVPVVTTRIYFGYDDQAPNSTAQITASLNYKDVPVGLDYSIDFTANLLPKVNWFAEQITEPVKTYVYMNGGNNFLIAANTPFGPPSIIDNLRLYQTYKTSFSEASQIKKTSTSL